MENDFGSSQSGVVPLASPAGGNRGTVYRHRRVGWRAKRTLRILRGAIEYLANESDPDDALVDLKNDRIEAIRMLMALNHEIYFACPIAPTLADRCRAFMHPELA